MSSPSPLVRIAALVRAGGVDQAWTQFVQADLAVSSDPAALTLKGRLLKERARAAQGDARRSLFGEAAAAYEEAAQQSEDAYPLINAATLRLLAGDSETAKVHAQAVLAAPDQDTPFYQSATRAEALLVLGRITDAERTLQDAVARGPRAWEDHAVALRQFRLILEALGEDDGWLTILAPPRALHFTGHMALPVDDRAITEIALRMITEERVSFGYGALAAGADILIAEALTRAGVELYVVLPVQPATFREQSVRPWGEAWTPRFERLLDLATDVQVVSNSALVSQESVALADETAMGMAVLRAESLTGEAIQLAVLDEDGGRGPTANRWSDAGRRQRIVHASRVPGEVVADAFGADLRATAFLGCKLALPQEASADKVLQALARAIGDGPSPKTEPSWCGRTLLLTYGTPRAAIDAADAIRWVLGDKVRIAAGYGLVMLIDSPFGPDQLAVGDAPEAVAECLAITPPGAIYLDLPFAAALSLEAPTGATTRIMNLTGDVLGPYALKL